ncbi:hypothetical protein KQI63_10295 [bacterium]|nr:hypothetical protein [bacterium]
MSDKTTLVYLPVPINSHWFPLIERLARSEGWTFVTREKGAIEEQLSTFDSRLTSSWQAGEDELRFLSEVVKSLGDIDPQPEFDLALVDDMVYLDMEEGEEKDEILDGVKTWLYLIDSPHPVTDDFDDDSVYADRVVGIRSTMQSGTLIGLETVPLPDSTNENLQQTDRLLSTTGLSVTRLNFDAPGGGAARVLFPLFNEAWRLVRETGVAPSTVDYLSKQMLGLKEGLFELMSGENRDLLAIEGSALGRATMWNERFTPSVDWIPRGAGYGVWESLENTAEPLAGPEPEAMPENILIVGTPHLVDLWRDRIYQASNGRLEADAWRIWDLAAVQESEIKTISQRGPYDLVIEVLIGPSDDRQQLLTLLSQHVREQGQVWVQTLNLPATLVVSVIPVDLCAVGFTGLPSLGDKPLIELSRPRNSDGSDLLRAAGLATMIGLEPYEVADEPGGVGGRLLAQLINSTAYLVRDGILSSDAEADRLVKRLLGMESSALSIADLVGLDSIEGVLIGLHAFLGENRYRVCPNLTLRIESGAIGQITESGFYV